MIHNRRQALFFQFSTKSDPTFHYSTCALLRGHLSNSEALVCFEMLTVSSNEIICYWQQCSGSSSSSLGQSTTWSHQRCRSTQRAPAAVALHGYDPAGHCHNSSSFCSRSTLFTTTPGEKQAN